MSYACEGSIMNAATNDLFDGWSLLATVFFVAAEFALVKVGSSHIEALARTVFC